MVVYTKQVNGWDIPKDMLNVQTMQSQCKPLWKGVTMYCSVEGNNLGSKYLGDGRYTVTSGVVQF